ncbi:oligosaccharide flippase family protein [Francisellaceae bacterium CB300]
MSSFTKNVITLMTGTAVAQAIPIAISPILTRIYTPQDFGVFALFFSIVVVLGIIMNARYELAIMLPKKDEDAINVFALGFIINVVLSLFILVFIILFHSQFIRWLGSDSLSVWLYFIPFTVFFMGIWNILNYFNNRKKQYKDIARATILKSLVLAIVQLSIGFIKQGAMGLISGQILSNIFGNMRLAKNIVKDKVLMSKISKVKIIVMAKRYKDFPKYTMWADFANSLTSQLPVFMIAKIYGASTLGFFIIAQKIVTLPASLISTSFSQVFFQRLTEAKNNNQMCLPILLKAIKKLFFVSLPIATAIFVVGPYVVVFAFGSSWHISGEIIRYLSLIFMITFIVSPISISLIVSKDNKLLSLWQYSYLIFGVLFFAIFYFILNVKYQDFFFWYVIYQYISYIIYLVLIVVRVNVMDKKSKLKCR